ncbi:hypothetical protein [Sorangium sp. So ce590]|uniref:hypothetical protein n=1 Tax=unclassified Sorangium TaxID=2621164 RepID=UPI003F5ECFD7
MEAIPAGANAPAWPAALVRLGADLAALGIDDVGRLAHLLTARDDRAPGAPGKSSLNADGTPLQLCLTSRRDGWDMRLIGDPATHLADPEARAEATRAAVGPVLAAARADRLAPLVAKSWDLLLPHDGELTVYVEGVAWFGAAPRIPGCAIYFDVTKGALEARWRRVAEWLAAIAGPEAARVVDRLRPAGLPMAAGLEGVDERFVRLKIYWRLACAAPLAAFGLPLLTDPAMADFVRLLIGDRVIDGDGLVLAVGLDPRDGRVIDVKADVCGAHCLGYAAAEWIDRIGALSARFALAALPVARALAQGGRVSYVGFGLDVAGGARLNLYLGAST